MGRTPGDLDDIFAAADANDGKLTKEIFDEHDGSEVMTYGNAQRRYKQHRAAGSTHAAGCPLNRSLFILGKCLCRKFNSSRQMSRRDMTFEFIYSRQCRDMTRHFTFTEG